MLVVLNEDQFPVEGVSACQNVTLRNDSADSGIEYEIIGTVKDAELVIICDDERLKSFFSKTGRKFLEEVRVQDLVSERVVQRVFGEYKVVEEDVRQAKRKKRERQKEVGQI